MNYICAASHLCVLRERLELTNVNFLRGVSSSGVVEVFAVNESELFTCGFPCLCNYGVLCLQRMDVNFLRGVSSSGVMEVFALIDRTL